MEVAIENGLPGITGDCGGDCGCSTCHAYVDAAWLTKLPPASDEEIEILNCAFDIRPNSRLTCQLQVTDELDGLVIRLPEPEL